MSPLSDTFAALLLAHVVLGLALGFRVIYLRLKHGVGIGDGENRPLRRAIRAHGNFAEWVPLSLLALGVAELRGAPEAWIMGLGGAMLLGRLMHGVGLNKSGGPGLLRQGGMTLSLLTLLAAAVVAVWPGG